MANGYGSNRLFASPTSPIDLGAVHASPSQRERHTCAILDDNTVKCWGRNNNGQLGYDDTTRSRSPNAVNLGVVRQRPSQQDFHTCVILENDTSVLGIQQRRPARLRRHQPAQQTDKHRDLGAGRTESPSPRTRIHLCAVRGRSVGSHKSQLGMATHTTQCPHIPVTLALKKQQYVRNARSNHLPKSLPKNTRIGLEKQHARTTAQKASMDSRFL